MMKHTFTIALVVAMSLPGFAGSMDPRSLFDTYESYRLSAVSGPKMKHAELVQHLLKLQQDMRGSMSIEVAGNSAEGRSINLVTLGTGKKKIFFWSQMHGDEPTATMGILDVLSYFSRNLESSGVQKILKETTLLFLPMVNPDGAERYQRWNVHGIDINRDALRLQTPEARILKSIRDRFDPQYGFNLHDQDGHTPVGTSSRIAAIALLAPAFNEAKEDNEIRLRAKKVAAVVTDVLNGFIPGHVARYDDTFEPRAFGDNIQRWGTSTVLIESGGWKGDPDKIFLRKLNCVVLLAAAASIASDDYMKAEIAHYENLEENGKKIYDLIITGVKLVSADSLAPVIVDLGINQRMVRDKSGVDHLVSRVAEIGDLSFTPAIERLDARGETMPLESVKLERNVALDQLLDKLKK